MKNLEERLLIIEDEMAIRNLAAKFADTATIADFEGFKTLWKPDAVFTINQPFFNSKKGTDDISAFLKQLWEGKEFFVQFLHSGVIKIDSNMATARWIVQEVAQGPGETYYNNYGVFSDTMEKINGEWVYAIRSYNYMWIDTGKFQGQTVKLPDFK